MSFRDDVAALVTRLEGSQNDAVAPEVAVRAFMVRLKAAEQVEQQRADIEKRLAQARAAQQRALAQEEWAAKACQELRMRYGLADTDDPLMVAEAAQERLGWQSQTQISGESEGLRSLQVRLTDRDGRPLAGLTLVAHLVRPSNEGLDTTIVPRPLGDGRYGASFTLPAAGQWELRLVAHDGDVAWQHSERLFVK